jgi:NAD dependent epimerase/dehydratase family enzyme
LDSDQVSGTVNATAPEPVTNKEFSKALGRAVKRPAIAPVPGFILDLKFGSEFGHVLRGGQRVLPRRTQELGYGFKHPRLDEALADLV